MKLHKTTADQPVAYYATALEVFNTETGRAYTGCFRKDHQEQMAFLKELAENTGLHTWAIRNLHTGEVVAKLA